MWGFRSTHCSMPGSKPGIYFLNFWLSRNTSLMTEPTQEKGLHRGDTWVSPRAWENQTVYNIGILSQTHTKSAKVSIVGIDHWSQHICSFWMIPFQNGLPGLLTAGESMGYSSSWQALSVQSWITALRGCQSDLEGTWRIQHPECAPS